MDRNIEDEETREEAKVVPYVGTWIEISCLPPLSLSDPVVPYVGTWIEIMS